jgi:NAD-dependent deacetylase
MKKIVVLTGAGISAESGLKTFRDSNGLWRNYRFEEVASPVAWAQNPELVLEFYNIRRKQLLEVEPNAAHYALVDLEAKYDVRIVTQNIDDLHERAGSNNVLHIHGELRKARSTADPSLIYDIEGWELKWGDQCEKGSQLRPHVVWFGEPVELMPRAEALMRQADILMVIGTSLVVYPAAGLIYDVDAAVPKYYVDPNAKNIGGMRNLTPIAGKAAEVLPGLVERLLKEA